MLGNSFVLVPLSHSYSKHRPDLQQQAGTVQHMVITRNPGVYAALYLELRPAPVDVVASLQDVSSLCGQPRLILTTSPTGSPEQ